MAFFFTGLGTVVVGATVVVVVDVVVVVVGGVSPLTSRFAAVTVTALLESALSTACVVTSMAPPMVSPLSVALSTMTVIE